MPRRTYNIMGLLHVWNSILFLLTAVRTRGSTFHGTEKEIMHAIAGNPLIFRTWSMIGSTVYITIIKDNNTILDLSMDIPTDKNVTVQNSRMMVGYNQTIQEQYLLFENISKEDGGIYEIKESFYGTKTGIKTEDTDSDTYDIKDGTWYLEIYVLGPGETKQGYVGGNISMGFAMSEQHSILYNYDKLGALLAGSTGSVLTDSSLYGRLRCAIDDSSRMYKITIVNVSQRDAGLYKLATGRDETERCFFSIEDVPACAVVGENMTIGWFYNQQGIKRILRVIHPKQGVMMLVNQTNSPQVKNNFQRRLLYNGDTLQSFMSFTLLNVTQYDAGLYTIETRHGNIIHGSKKLNVEGTCTQGGGTQTTLYDVTSDISDTKQEIVKLQPTERQCVPISIVIQVVIVAVVSIAIIAMTGYLIWVQRRNSYKLEAVQCLVERCETRSLATPYLMRRHINRSYLAEEWDIRLTPSNDLLHYSDAAIPSESGMAGTTGYSTVLLSEVEDDIQGVHFIADHNGLSKMTDGGILTACVKLSEDGNLHSYPSIYSLAKAAYDVEYGDNCIVDGMDTRHDPHTIRPLYGKDKQRRVIQQCEISSFVTPSPIRKPPYMRQNGDTSTHGQVHERTKLTNAMLSLPFTAISTASASLSEPDDVKPSVYSITKQSYATGQTDEMTLVSCDREAYDGVLDACAPRCTLGSASVCKQHIYKCILNGNSSSQVSQSTQSLHSHIKKGPNFAFRNNTTNSTLCTTDYEMANLSTDFDQEQT